MNSEKSKSNDVKISYLKRIIDKFRYGLVLQAIRNKLSRVGFEILPFYLVQEGIDHMEEPVIIGSSSEYKTEFLTEQEMKFIGENARGYPENEISSWIQDGKKCLGLKHKNEILAFMWINLKVLSFAPLGFILKDDEAYLTDMYTMEKHRGKNIAPYLRFQSYIVLNKLGRHKLYSVSEYFNSSAIRYKQKLNAKNLKLMLFVRVFKKFRWSYTLKSYSKV